MKKVAIVGVEGSGKTVMFAGLGDQYTYPDEDGYFLAPKNFSTAAYVAEKIERMRRGEWPAATAGDEMQGLDWTLERKEPGARRPPEKICEVSFLDFAGEVYRTAFGIGAEESSLAEQAEELKRYVQDADDLIVLINLRDVIVHGIRDRRVQEAMWITNAILDAALPEQDGRKAPRAAIVLSQADSYAETIASCGGALGVLRKYLPHVANRYDWLDVFAANAVDKTILDDDGSMVPKADFTSKGLLPIMAWIRGEEVSDNGGQWATDMHEKAPDGGRGATALPEDASAEGARLLRPENPVGGMPDGAKAAKRVQLWKGGPYWADRNIGAEKPWDSGSYFWWGDTVGYKRENNAFVASDGLVSCYSFSIENIPIFNRDISALHGARWIVLGEEKEKKNLLGKLFGLKEREDSILTSTHDAAQMHWGGGWRMPTRLEMRDLYSRCDWTWATMHGVNGYIVRGKDGYASNSIFLPAAGYGDGTSLHYSGSYGYYWSSVPYSGSSRCSWYHFFSSSCLGTYYNYRYYGFSVRPVQGFTKYRTK